MWFYAEINKNPELLQNLVTQNDIISIAKTIDAENNEYICSRISFELTLGGNSGESPYSSPSRTPLLLVCFDVLDEKFFIEKKETTIKQKLEELQYYLHHVNELLGEKDIVDILLHSDMYTDLEIAQLKHLSSKTKDDFSYLLFDLNKHKFDINQLRKKTMSWGKPWGKLGFYSIYVEKVADLYAELSGKDFTSDFEENHYGAWGPATEGTRFLCKFHEIINRIAIAYKIKPFTDKNLKTASNAMRTQLNSLRKNEN